MRSRRPIAPDPYTIVIRLKRPTLRCSASSALGGAGYPPLPAASARKAARPQRGRFQRPPAFERPLSASSEWNHGTSLVFVPNPRYFRGAPKLKEVVWRIVPDVNTLFNQLADARDRRVSQREPERDRAAVRHRRHHRRSPPDRQLAAPRHQHEPPAAQRRARAPRDRRGRRLETHQRHRLSRHRPACRLRHLSRVVGGAGASAVSLRSRRRAAAAGRGRAGSPRRTACCTKAR